MNNNQKPVLSNEYLTHEPEPFLNQQTEINETVPSDQSVQMTVTTEEQFLLLNSIYDGCLNAADDQHTGSLVLDYLTEYNEEFDHYVIRSNPEAEKIFARIEAVKRIVDQHLVQAYHESQPNSLFGMAGIKYAVGDKKLVQLLKR
jgi:hypothetical protein